MPGNVPEPNALDIIIVGAGVIGVACALQLARLGLKVEVVDGGAPGHGASWGNAGHIATEQVFPIADATLLKRLPRMLLDPMGPLRLDWRYLPRATPWLVRLLLNLRPGPFSRTVAGLRALNESSLAAWERLLSGINQSALLKHEGSLLVYEHAHSRPGLEALLARMRAQNVPVDRWDALAIQAAAPQLSERIAGGLFFPATAHVLDPFRVVTAMVEAARAAGVRFRQQRVIDGQVQADGVSLRCEHGSMRARRVVIACGAHSAALTLALTGKRVPLDTERGYHLMLPREQGRLPFAVTSLERKFIMTPMSGGLRLAGTVEFAGLDRPANMGRAWQLERLSHGLFRKALNTEGATLWMGLRPSLPDSLPVIDRAANGKVLLAFGHQHLGLTQAAITAEMIAALAGPGLTGPGLPHQEPYRLARF